MKHDIQIREEEAHYIWRALKFYRDETSHPRKNNEVGVGLLKGKEKDVITDIIKQLESLLWYKDKEAENYGKYL